MEKEIKPIPRTYKVNPTVYKNAKKICALKESNVAATVTALLEKYVEKNIHLLSK